MSISSDDLLEVEFNKLIALYKQLEKPLPSITQLYQEAAEVLERRRKVALDNISIAAAANSSSHAGTVAISSDPIRAAATVQNLHIASANTVNITTAAVSSTLDRSSFLSH